jgi:cysteine desulfurase/selenocysteine lyase
MQPLEQFRQDFPILRRMIGDVPLAYLDSAATSQKPEAVLRVLDEYYRQHNANVHRGVHTLSEEATALYEGTRAKVARLINAASEREIVFTRGTTEGINLVAQSWGRANLGPGDEVLITEMEHHSNIVPWQLLQAQLGFTLRFIPLTDDGQLDLSQLGSLLNERTKLVSFVHVSNALGTINPVAQLTQAAHAVGARVLIDGAQSVPHMPVDVQALDVDFLVFSSHNCAAQLGRGSSTGSGPYLKRCRLSSVAVI